MKQDKKQQQYSDTDAPIAATQEPAVKAPPADPNNIMHHENKELSPDANNTVQSIKDKGREFYLYIHNLGESRENSIAKTKIEEAVMWAVKNHTK